jgi:hypothetical protein
LSLIYTLDPYHSFLSAANSSTEPSFLIKPGNQDECNQEEQSVGTSLASKGLIQLLKVHWMMHGTQLKDELMHCLSRRIRPCYQHQSSCLSISRGKKIVMGHSVLAFVSDALRLFGAQGKKCYLLLVFWG